MLLTKEKILSIEKHREQGKTNAEIAELLGTSESTIIRWVKRLRESGRDVPKRVGGGKKIEL